MTPYQQKILTLQDLPAWRESLRNTSQRLVVTNGCFDLLHLGHLTYLQQAREQGDLLLLGVNSDSSVRALKGPLRPLVSEDHRIGLIAGLECVTAACLFTQPSATEFLRIAQPDIYVKGGDYTPESLNPEEKKILQNLGAKVTILPFLPGLSTSSLIQKIILQHSSNP